LADKFKVSLQPDKNKGTLNKHLCSFKKTSHLVLF